MDNRPTKRRKLRHWLSGVSPKHYNGLNGCIPPIIAVLIIAVDIWQSLVDLAGKCVWSAGSFDNSLFSFD